MSIQNSTTLIRIKYDGSFENGSATKNVFHILEKYQRLLSQFSSDHEESTGVVHWAVQLR
jgi:hypothetical protein